MINNYKIMPVDSSAGKFGVFEPSGDYLYEVFETREEAESYAEKMEKLDENIQMRDHK